MVRIVTDSTCDLTPEQASQLGIATVVPLYVRFGEDQYQDGITIDRQKFHQLIKTHPSFPTTSQPSVGDFAKVYEQYKGDEIVSIHISRELSGTIASAEAARELTGANVTIVDSRNVNAGLSLLLIEASRLAKSGATAAQIKSEIEALVPRVRLIFAVETLENLRRGGRIGGAQAFLGSMLQFKPIITIKDGRVEPLERVRTMAKAVARLKELAAQDLNNQSHRRVCFMHVAAPSAAENLKNALSAEVKLDEPMVIEAGPVIATHAGPGAVGVAYIV
ncbi:MAG: DegV family protein [Anaerolineae bacterium]|nr:DegV family protein [Thermoflexales bacterium]MDW8408266.1 DegV family protein [Anaerolineae bacterium]